jgi:hypothetical protein
VTLRKVEVAVHKLLLTLLLGACSPVERAAAPFVLWVTVKKVFDYNCHSCHNSSSSIGNWSKQSEAEAKKDEINFRVCQARTMPPNYISKPERELICDWSKQ